MEIKLAPRSRAYDKAGPGGSTAAHPCFDHLVFRYKNRIWWHQNVDQNEVAWLFGSHFILAKRG